MQEVDLHHHYKELAG